jgi:hypothetical protein
VRRDSRLALTVAISIAVVACSADERNPSGPPTGAAAKYCQETGGTVETRHPYWNTNQEQSGWVELPGEIKLCWYETLGDEDGSRIYLDLETLYSETPTLAAATYLAQLPLGQASGNPAAVNCNEQLLGSASFGNTAAGGDGSISTTTSSRWSTCVSSQMGRPSTSGQSRITPTGPSGDSTSPRCSDSIRTMSRPCSEEPAPGADA